MKNKEKRTAIRHARNVPKDAIDWPRAFMLVLESHAHVGDIEALSAEIRTAPEFVSPQFFIHYVCQIAVENSAHPEEALERAVATIEETTRRSQPGIGAFSMWNRQSCKLAVQFVEQQQQIALRELALEQGGPVDHAKEKGVVSLRSRQLACPPQPAAELAPIRKTSAQRAFKTVEEISISLSLVAYTGRTLGVGTSVVQRVIAPAEKRGVQ